MSNCNEIKIKEWHFSVSDPFALLEVIKETKVTPEMRNEVVPPLSSGVIQEQAKGLRSAFDLENASGKMAKPLTTPAKQEEKEGKSL